MPRNPSLDLAWQIRYSSWDYKTFFGGNLDLPKIKI